MPLNEKGIHPCPDGHGDIYDPGQCLQTRFRTAAAGTHAGEGAAGVTGSYVCPTHRTTAAQHSGTWGST